MKNQKIVVISLDSEKANQVDELNNELKDGWIVKKQDIAQSVQAGNGYVPAKLVVLLERDCE